MDYENKTGSDLDKYMKMFNIYRTQGNSQDIYQFNISNKGAEQIKLIKDTIFYFENNFYKLSKDISLNRNAKSVISAYKTYSSYSFDIPIFSAGGEIKFDKKNLEYSNLINIAEYFPKNIKLLSYSFLPNDSESDISFLERSKSIISSMGYSNNKKIENAILSNSDIKSINMETINGLTTITIFPNSLSNIDDLINYSNEIVRYYQNSNIKVVKPNLIEIRVTNLKIQLMHISEYEKILNVINNSLTEYLSNSLIENSITRNDIISIISDTLKTYDIYNDVNINYIKIKNYFYWNTNYNDPILIETIDDKLDIGNNNIISLGEIS